MATITLYAGKVNQMSSLINHARKAVKEYKSDLKSLKSKVLSIDESICDVDDVISSIKSSTQTQEDKIESLESLKENINEYISDVMIIDQNAADAINKSKNDFYDKYEYLTPECEKSRWEKFKDGCKKVGEWCKEHWKEIFITVTIVIGAVLAIVAVVASGGLALMPLLTGLGLSASAAASISTIVGAVAVISTIGSSILNLINTWCDIDSSTFKTLKNVFNWTSIISNGVYSFGYIYNGFKGISNAAIKEMNGNRLVNITRWGRPGLQSGDWVMKGNNTWYNYIRSFKWDFISPTNTIAPKSIGETFLVPLKTLHRPKGFGIDGAWKIIFGQWRYFP